MDSLFGGGGGDIEIPDSIQKLYDKQGNLIDAQIGAIDKLIGIAEGQQKIATAQWSRYNKAFVPVEDTLIKESQLPARQQPGMAATLAGIDKSYGTAGAEMDKTLASKYQWGSGLGEGLKRSLELNRTRDMYKTEADWNNQRMQRMYSMAALGKGLPSSALAGMSGAAGTMGGAVSGYGSASSAIGSQANSLMNMWMSQQQANQAANNSAWRSMGQMFGNLAQIGLALI